MENINNVNRRMRYSFIENISIEFFLWVNTKFILNSYFGKINYKDLYKSLQILLPKRSLNNLKTKFFNILKSNFKNYIIRIDSILPSLKSQTQEKIIVPDQNHIKFYIKYINSNNKKFNFKNNDNRIKFYMMFINSQEKIFSTWIIKDEKKSKSFDEESMKNFYFIKNRLKKINSSKVKLDNNLLNEFKSLKDDIVNYLNENQD